MGASCNRMPLISDHTGRAGNPTRVQRPSAGHGSRQNSTLSNTAEVVRRCPRCEKQFSSKRRTNASTSSGNDDCEDSGLSSNELSGLVRNDSNSSGISSSGSVFVSAPHRVELRIPTSQNDQSDIINNNNYKARESVNNSSQPPVYPMTLENGPTRNRIQTIDAAFNEVTFDSSNECLDSKVCDNAEHFDESDASVSNKRSVSTLACKTDKSRPFSRTESVKLFDSSLNRTAGGNSSIWTHRSERLTKWITGDIFDGSLPRELSPYEVNSTCWSEDNFSVLANTSQSVGRFEISSENESEAYLDAGPEANWTIQDPASQRLTWYKPPLSVLVIKKVRDAMVIPPFLELVTWLTQEKHMVVFVEASVLDDRLVTSHPMYPAVRDKLMSFREKHDDLTDKIDFIICMGGDGTLLYASSLFQQSVPPVMAFHLGSLGFLTPFKFINYQEQVTNVLEGHAALTLRSRLRCIILRRGQEKQLQTPNHETDTNSTSSSNSTTNNASSIPSAGVKVPTNLLVLNEVVIDRGPSPYLSNLDLYLDGKRITSVQGDGLIVSTPTGSTAYAVAAGASMIHPSVPAIMVTPICPHSLSFRPIIVPAGVELKITVSKDSRNTAWISFDGRMRQELKHDDSLRVTTSIYPRHLDDINPNTDDGNLSESSSPSSSVPTTPTSIVPGGGTVPETGGLHCVVEKVEEEEDGGDEESRSDEQEA
ncbi:NAD kinase [Trinorchestia longiramus]|nr:NAD kinase [Trinorchestia longiramus]